MPAKEEDARFMEMWVPIAEGLMKEGKIRCHPFSVRAGGLRGVLEGLSDLREGRVSAEKVVYRVKDTE